MFHHSAIAVSPSLVVPYQSTFLLYAHELHVSQVVVIEQNPCGQFSYPTIQYVPANGRIFVAYTVLFLPASMPADCKVRSLCRAWRVTYI